MEKQLIGLTRKEWQMILTALTFCQQRPDDNFAKLRLRITELLGTGVPKEKVK